MTVSPSPEQLSEPLATLAMAIKLSRDWSIKGWPKQASAVFLSKREAIELYGALESAQAEIARLTTALAWFDKHGEHLANDVSSGHSARGSAASEWMREDDADFRRDLREALAVARAALKGNQP